jgi:glutathione S-transferase
MSILRVSTFEADWGLPTTGPFALKLLAWLRLNGIAYEQVFENDSRKGPLGKSPWIEHDGRRLGDSDAIIRHLAGRFDVPIEPQSADPVLSAAAHAFKVAFEEEFHQILEWELFCHPAGVAYIDRQIREAAPPLLGAPLSRLVRRHFRHQLHARGIGRHDAETVLAKARADLDALVAFLSNRPYLTGATPVLADLAVFGQVTPMLHWTMDTPVSRYARALAPIQAWSGRIMARCFPEMPAASGQALAGEPLAAPTHLPRARPEPLQAVRG